MARTIKLNGTIKVGLGQSPSGKILEGAQFVHFYMKHEDEKEQARKLRVALQWHRETGKKMFYSHNSRGYQKITEDWIINRIQALEERI